MFSFISFIYNTAFLEPLLNGLVFLVGHVPFHDIGLAIIILTLVVRLIIFPFNHKSLMAQRKIKHLAPEIEVIKDKHKNDPREKAKKTMELYKKHGINPMSGFLALLIQIPIILALYKVFLGGMDFDTSKLYSFIAVPDQISTVFLGLIDVTKSSYAMAFLAALSQFFQMRLAIPPLSNTKKPAGQETFKDNLAKSMSIQMRYVMPFFIFFIALKLSSAIAIYWTTMNVFAIVHEIVVKRKADKLLKENA
ncbi:MAG: hypothetical protein COV02_02340 [Candidatus Terrybacteria bacterium CG10_big_fil_rev_8_21_14_0_10_41_10]|uniref:Membrane insertase YidC/Oxa/ALB C-terminal domain-containing protein n=1 Tax=Candidatus Terrybacteria bacterium CG10_big_fil_rev_8_21_14_0_10_41_10 TaxID=1975026 RepID=A0A2M8LA47_9BACT|nr:MAG: hypothetical protein COV02_02340 [Candidatus Terrybacteria bacterium CG10_big_fil_rev_8_21_14_0_10_41_10]